jgi:hypothetical protein
LRRHTGIFISYPSSASPSSSYLPHIISLFLISSSYISLFLISSSYHLPSLISLVCMRLHISPLAPNCSQLAAPSDLISLWRCMHPCCMSSQMQVFIEAQHSLNLQALLSSVSLSRYAETRDIATLRTKRGGKVIVVRQRECKTKRGGEELQNEKRRTRNRKAA